jgi:hypothetical protein
MLVGIGRQVDFADTGHERHRPEARQPLQDAREGVAARLQSRESIEGERAAQLMRLRQPFVASQSAGA